MCFLWRNTGLKVIPKLSLLYLGRDKLAMFTIIVYINIIVYMYL